MFQKKDLRNKIRTIEDREYRTVEVKEWNETLTVRSMTAGQYGRIQKMFGVTDLSGKKDEYHLIHATAVAMCVVDPETKQPIFTKEDVYWLKDKHAGALQTIWEVVSDMNHLEKNTEEDSKNESEANLESDSHFD